MDLRGELKCCGGPFSSTSKHSFMESADYIKERFLQIRVGEGRIFPHFTCAVDTDNIKLVWFDVRDMICKKLLNELC